MLKTINVNQSIYPILIFVNSLMQDINGSNRSFIELANLGHLAG